MLLRCTDPEDAGFEAELRKYLINAIGETDQQTIVDWLHDNQTAALGQNGASYIDALDALVLQTQTKGLDFLRRVLDFAKTSKPERDARVHLAMFMTPLIQRACAKVNALPKQDRRAAAQQEFMELCERLQEELYRMFPDRHRATIKGAMLTGFVHGGGGFQLDHAKIMKTLFAPDALSATAAQSRRAG